MITIEQLKEAKDRVDALNRYLDIDAKTIELEEEQLRTQAPGFWDDAKKAEEQMKKVKTLEKWIEGYKNVKMLVDELELAFDFYKDEMVTEEEVDANYAQAIEAIEALELKKKTVWPVCSKSTRVPVEQRAKTGPRCLCVCICDMLKLKATRWLFPTCKTVMRPASKP